MRDDQGPDPSARIAVVGPGRMGIGITLALAKGGRTVDLLDVKDRPEEERFSSLEGAERQIRSNLEFLSDQGALEENLEEVMNRISLTRDVAGTLTEAGFVFEALPEDPDIKREFLDRADPHLDERTILTSATSTISLETLSEGVSHPSRMLITHWLNPAFIIPLVEVARTETTDDAVVKETVSLLEEVGKVPAVCRDAPGFIGSRIQAAAFNEAIRIYEEGVASIEEIDRAFKAGQGFRLAVLGLIEFVDLGGVDILYYADQYLSEKLGPRYDPPPSVVEKFESGELGPESGMGYYDYSEIDVDDMFKRKYAAFLELLQFIESSEHLDFTTL